MSRINTNIPSMIAGKVLASNNLGLNQSLQRLSTGLRINVGKDDPAGLIASEMLRSEKIAIGAAMTNISRANNVIATAEGGMDEVNKLLTELEDLIDRSANEAALSHDELEANQLQIDAILSSINRIASSTEFQGRKLLSGELDYTTSGVVSTDFADVDILGARIAEGQSRNVTVQVTASAELASLTYTGATTTSGTTSIEVGGRLGTETLSFGSGTTISSVALAVNAVKELTGISATVTGATTLEFNSTEYGSKQFVQVKQLIGAFAVTGGDAGDDKDEGEDAGVLINGVQASVEGLRARLNSTVLSVDLTLTSTFGTTPGQSSFEVTGGGADFMISPTVSLNGQASLGIRAMSVGQLGSNDVGYIASLGSGQDNSIDSRNFTTAQRIVRLAQTQVAQLRGRLGAFQKDTLTTMGNALSITLENTTAAEASIRDTDFATETSQLTRSQILVQSATNVLRISNQQPQAILALLQ